MSATTFQAGTTIQFGPEESDSHCCKVMTPLPTHLIPAECICIQKSNMKRQHRYFLKRFSVQATICIDLSMSCGIFIQTSPSRQHQTHRHRGVGTWAHCSSHLRDVHGRSRRLGICRSSKNDFDFGFPGCRSMGSGGFL